MNKIRKSGKTINGKRVGPWYFYYENGLPYLYCSYIDGNEYGLWFEWYENGILKEVLNFADVDCIPVFFALESGEVLMKEGTGKRIEKFGTGGFDIFESHFVNGNLVKYEQTNRANYLKFDKL